MTAMNSSTYQERTLAIPLTVPRAILYSCETLDVPVKYTIENPQAADVRTPTDIELSWRGSSFSSFLVDVSDNYRYHYSRLMTKNIASKGEKYADELQKLASWGEKLAGIMDRRRRCEILNMGGTAYWLDIAQAEMTEGIRQILYIKILLEAEH